MPQAHATRTDVKKISGDLTVTYEIVGVVRCQVCGGVVAIISTTERSTRLRCLECHRDGLFELTEIVEGDGGT